VIRHAVLLIGMMLFDRLLDRDDAGHRGALRERRREPSAKPATG